MTKEEFLEFHKKNAPIYLDGATGTNLIRAGMPSGVCPEVWTLEHPDVIVKLQKGYVEAGSNIIYAPTFGANKIKLAEYGYEDRVEELNAKLVKLAKEAASGKALVAGDLTMCGRQLEPIGDLKLETLIDVYKEQIQALYAAGADLLVCETMMSLAECRAALIAAKETCDLAVMCTMTFESDGKTLFGTDPAAAAVTLERLGACAVGANCSTGPDKMVPVIRAMAEVTSIPIIAKPNAGLPSLGEDGMTNYDLGIEDFAREMQQLLPAGASIIGGCCGSTPDYIKALKKTTGAD